MQTQWHLRNKDFFQDMGEARERFFQAASRIALDKNSIVFFEGDPGGACYYIASGIVRIFSLTGSGKEPIFFLRRRGEFFGLSEVLDDVPRKANAQTLAPVVLYRMDRPAFRAFLAENTEASYRIISLLGSRVRYLGDRISLLMTCGVMDRLIKLLVSIVYDSLPDAQAWERPVTLPVRLSQEQIASMTGSTQPTVSECLRLLQNEGLIAVSRKKIEILNPLALLARVEHTLP